MGGRMVKSELNQRQRSFVANYLAHGVAQRAALEAGYSPRTARGAAHRLLANVGIAAAIARGRARAADRAEVTLEECIRGLHAEALRQGEGTSQAARVRAWEVLGKHLGLRTKVEVEHSGALTLDALLRAETEDAEREGGG